MTEEDQNNKNQNSDENDPDDDLYEISVKSVNTPPPTVPPQPQRPRFLKKHGFILQNQRKCSYTTGAGAGDGHSHSPDSDSFQDSQSNILTSDLLGSPSHSSGHGKSARAGDSNGANGSDDIPELGAILPDEIVGFDFKFIKRFLKIHSILFKSLKSISSILFFLLLLVALLEQYVIYQVGLVPSKFYQVLGAKDLDGFKNATLISIGWICGVAFVKGTKQLIQKLLTASWRKLLCLSLHDKYFSKIHFYQLNVLDKLIDNPDQRITQDVDKFTATYCEILPKFLISPFVIAYYSYQAFSRAGWIGPVGCFSFFLVGSLINRFVMSPVVRFIVKQEKCEGDFRFLHMLVRINSEPIAFMNASNLESHRANESLNHLIQTQNRLYLRQYAVNICINLFDYLGSIVSYIVLAIPIFAGVYDHLDPKDLPSIISQNSFVSMYLIYQFSQLVDLSVEITEVIGVSHRIAQLIERLGALNVIWKDMFPHEKDLLSTNSPDFNLYKQNQLLNRQHSEKGLVPVWTLEKVSFSPPFRDEELAKDLSITINAGESLLIVGGSSAGKSSLFRILRGLWPPTAGIIQRFYSLGPQNVYFCPQKPYLFVGTLREQICFPLTPSADHDTRKGDEELIINYLKKLHLQHLLERVETIDSPVSWSVYETLSPGEIQRLCFIRVFYHRPVIALLDESTSALPLNMEELIYTECQKLRITTISIAHRESLKKFHEKLLIFESFGGWRIENTNQHN